VPEIVEHILPLLPDNFTREQSSTLVRALPRMGGLPESQINRKINAVGMKTASKQKENVEVVVYRPGRKQVSSKQNEAY